MLFSRRHGWRGGFGEWEGGAKGDSGSVDSHESRLQTGHDGLLDLNRLFWRDLRG